MQPSACIAAVACRATHYAVLIAPNTYTQVLWMPSSTQYQQTTTSTPCLLCWPPVAAMSWLACPASSPPSTTLPLSATTWCSQAARLATLPWSRRCSTSAERRISLQMLRWVNLLLATVYPGACHVVGIRSMHAEAAVLDAGVVAAHALATLTGRCSRIVHVVVRVV